MLTDENKVKLRSLILEIFPKECLIDLYKLTRNQSVSTNQKRDLIFKILDKYQIEHEPIGSGTNRYSALIDGYIVKFAIDSDGLIDNMREFKYSMQLQPNVIKVYECLPDGLLSVSEYVELMSMDEFSNRKTVEMMKEILESYANNYFIGDVGINAKNYTNWGWRKNTKRELVILDFAYIYSTSFKNFRCQCDKKSIMFYDDKFDNLICPTCGRTWSFDDIRRRISKDDQWEEIGNIEEQGYVMHHPEEIKNFNNQFSFRFEKEDTKVKKKKKPISFFMRTAEDDKY